MIVPDHSCIFVYKLNTMTNNVSQIRTLLNFINPGDFYFIQIIKRRKDNPLLSRDMKLIDNWFIYSLQEYDEKAPKIIEQCRLNNARAYIRLNKRNDQKIALQTLRIIAGNIANQQYNIRNCYLSACGQFHSDANKTWIIDVDEPELELINDISLLIEQIYRNIGKTDGIIVKIPTKSGIHLITNPFDLQVFKGYFPQISVHKDNPTVLYQDTV